MRLNIAKNKQKPEEEALAPHSFVIHRGIVTKQLLRLTKDFRKVMEPFTASSLKVFKNMENYYLKSTFMMVLFCLWFLFCLRSAKKTLSVILCQ